MAKTNIELEVKRLNLRKSQILLSKETMEVRIAELLDEKIRIEENFPLYQKEIEEIEATIARIQAPPVKE